MMMTKKRKNLTVKVTMERMEKGPPTLQVVAIPAGVKTAEVHD